MIIAPFRQAIQHARRHDYGGLATRTYFVGAAVIGAAIGFRESEGAPLGKRAVAVFENVIVAPAVLPTTALIYAACALFKGRR